MSDPVPIIRRPNFFRYKLSGIRKNYEAHGEYYHSFSIVYKYLRVSTFFKKKGWCYREKKIFVPKIVNNLLKLFFGKTYYSVYRLEEGGHGYCSEMVDKKTAKRYVKEYKIEGCTDIHISEKERKYSGWLWVTKKEQKIEDAIFNFHLNMWS